MNIELIEYPDNWALIVAIAGRNCYGLEAPDDTSEFCKKMIELGHESVIEHINITLNIRDCSRSFMAQLTRHRHCSFSIKSQHFVNHKNFKYKELENYGDNVSSDFGKETYHKLMKVIDSAYNTLTEICGIPKYIAREILPNSCLTNIVMTTNCRELRNIIKLRITSNNTPEIQYFAKKILHLCYEIMPQLFYDLVEEYFKVH